MIHWDRAIRIPSLTLLIPLLIPVAFVSQQFRLYPRSVPLLIASPRHFIQRQTLIFKR